MRLITLYNLVKQLEKEDKSKAVLELIDLKTEEEMDKVLNKLDSMEAKFDTKFDAIEQKFDTKFDAIEQKFDTKFDAIEHKMVANNIKVIVAISTIIIAILKIWPIS